MSNTTTKPIHPFQAAGLGLAPFKLAGMVHQELSRGERVIGSVGGCEITTKPGGTCDYCGAYILNMFEIESSDGKRFHVGCDCVAKVGDQNLEKKVNEMVKQNKLDRDRKRIAAAKLLLYSTSRYPLQCQPHPAGREDSTLYNYCVWMMEHAGLSGKLRVSRIIEAANCKRINPE